MYLSPPVAKVIADKGLEQISDPAASEALVDNVFEANAQQVEDYRGGNDRLFGFFVGQVMKRSKGQANPQMVNDLLVQRLV